VEWILGQCERVLTQNIPEKIPVLDDGPSWIVIIGYFSPEVISGKNPGDEGFRLYPKGNRISLTSGGEGVREPNLRFAHGSVEDIASDRGRPRWFRRKGLIAPDTA
ncbi:MAG TPA: hypothetical protein VGD50_08105, partial [Candidatus Baltobacteraceae bacterium]